MTKKWIIILCSTIVLTALAIITFLSSIVDIKPGDEGFIFRPYGNGIDTENVYTEGTHFIAPWNQMITYKIITQSKEYQLDLKDKNGIDISIKADVHFSITRGNSANLHLALGRQFIYYVDEAVTQSITNAVNSHTYGDIFEFKRGEIELEIETTLAQELKEKFLTLHFVKITGVTLPDKIYQDHIKNGS